MIEITVNTDDREMREAANRFTQLGGKKFVVDEADLMSSGERSLKRALGRSVPTRSKIAEEIDKRI